MQRSDPSTGPSISHDHYDSIADAYPTRRRTDPRIAAQVWQALGNATTVLNVGAGTGSYEPPDRRVVSLDPSAAMLKARSAGSTLRVQGAVETLPFRDASVDAVMAILTLHHWQDPRRGVSECLRVARHRVVFLTWDPASTGFWLTNNYVPELLAIDRRLFPRLDELESWLGWTDVTPVHVPADCSDGFLGAYWRRPERYLDPETRAAMSSFSKVPHPRTGLEQLAGDLRTGVWAQRYGSLLAEDQLDVGYRLAVRVL